MTTWQFVDSIAASPTVLLDLNASPFFIDTSRVDLTPPEFDQSWSDNSLYHGSRLVWEKAQNRSLFIPVHIMTSTVAAQETAIQNLGLQIAKNGILKVQIGSTPIFFRTFGNPKYAMKVRRSLKDTGSVDLTILAEPFGYGTRVEVTGSPFTVNNDPANATNPCRFDITGVLGDASTPLLLVVASTGATGAPSGMINKQVHIGTRRRGTPSNYSNIIQGESMTLVNGAASTVVAGTSGGSVMRITPSGATMLVRAGNPFPSNGTSVIDARGQYKVYARCQKSIAGDTWDIQLKYGTSSVDCVANDVQRLPAAAAGPYYVDVGMVPCPAYSDPTFHGFSGVETKSQVPWISFWAQRVSGTGTLDVDFLYFMPADDQTLIAKFPNNDIQYAIDGTTDSGGAVYGFPYPAMDEILTTGSPVQVVGGAGFPEVLPGVTNRIHWLRNVDPAGTVDALANNTTVRAFYWPRWREAIRP
jgi:hypothetical protein